MLLRFTKMHGLGNDFMLVDLISRPVKLRPALIRKLADRRTGVGFDQLLTVAPPDDPEMDFRYTIYNADGSEAEQCGNGARCVLRFVRDRKLTARSAVRLETRGGAISCRLEETGDITVDMSRPLLAPEEIPFLVESAVESAATGAGAPEAAHRVILNDDTGASVCLTAVNVGNPHAVITVPDVAGAPVAEVGPLLERHPRFPQKTNVGFMEVVSRNRINLRVFERGVGETPACGSGACAAVVAGRLQGLLDETVAVRLAGGILTVRWEGCDAAMMMTGPAHRVYEGRIQI